jgi:hypothetical protein
MIFRIRNRVSAIRTAARLGGDPRGILLALFLLMGEVITMAENC